MFVKLLRIKILAKHKNMVKDENFSLETKWHLGKLLGFQSNTFNERSDFFRKKKEGKKEG